MTYDFVMISKKAVVAYLNEIHWRSEETEGNDVNIASNIFESELVTSK
jgi:hypothetical protein